MGGTEWLNTPSVDVSGFSSVSRTEWPNTPSMDVSGSSSVGGTECPETEVKKSGYLAHLELSQLIEISLEYPSRM